MYYPTNKDAEQRESEQRIAEHYRRAESVERFADPSRFLIAAQEAKNAGFNHFGEALEKLGKVSQMEDKNEA